MDIISEHVDQLVWSIGKKRSSVLLRVNEDELVRGL